MAASRKKGSLDAPPVNNNLPKGFKQFSGGDFPDVHDFKAKPQLLIAVTGIKTITVAAKGKKGTKNFKPAKDTRLVMGANPETGETSSFWESAGLSSLIDQIQPKDQVFLDYKGIIKTKDGNQFHKFETGVMTHDGRDLMEQKKDKKK